MWHLAQSEIAVELFAKIKTGFPGLRNKQNQILHTEKIYNTAQLCDIWHNF